MIKKVRLKNWTSHEDTTLVFEEGANLFIGSMGSGKSSVLEAISFALFGEMMSSYKNGTNDDYIRYGEKKAEVRVELELNGKKIVVERIIPKGKTTLAKLYVDGKLKVEGSKKVTSEIVEIIGMSKELFKKAVYAAQNELTALVSESQKDRKEAIDKLMGIELIQKTYETATTVANTLKKEKKVLEERVSREDASEISKQIDEIAEKIKSLSEKKKEIEKKLEEEMAAYKSIKTKVIELAKKEQTWDKLNREKMSLEGQIKELKEFLEGKEISSEERKELMEKMSWLDDKIKAMREKMHDIERGLVKISSDLKMAERERKRKKELRDRLTEIEEKIKNVSEEKLDKIIELNEAKRDEKLALISSLKEHILKAKSAVKTLNEAKSGTCPTCGTELGGEKIKQVVDFWLKDIDENEKKIERSKEEIEKITENLEKAKRIRRVLDRAIVEKKRIEEEIKGLKDIDEEELKKALDKMRKKKEEMQSEERELMDRRSELRAKIANIDEWIKKKKRLEESEKRLKDVNEAIGKVQYNKDELNKLREEEGKKHAEIRVLENEYNGIEQRLKELFAHSKTLQEHLNKIEKTKKELEKIEIASIELEKIKDTLLLFQKFKRDIVVEALNKAINDFWQILYPYNDYTTVKIEADSKGYNFFVYNGVDWIAIEKVASGGELTTFAIALRVAMSFILTERLSWLILDEPTHNLDERAIDQFAELVRKELPKVVNQFFIITHDERLKRGELGRIYLFKRGEMKTDSTKVEVLRT